MAFLTLSVVPMAFASGEQAPRAGGSAEDYRRAADFPDNARGLVLNETLTSFWLGDHGIVFRRQTTPDQWRFERVDVESGERRPAFDHAHVAKLLRERGHSAMPESLPVVLVPEDGSDTFLVVFKDVTLRVDGHSGDVTTADLDAGVLEPEQTERRRSSGGGEGTEVTFVNDTKGVINLIWLDWSGDPHSYGAIQPGDRRAQGTGSGHVWRVENEAGEALGFFEGLRIPRIVRISDATRPAEIENDGAAEPSRFFVRDHDLWERVPGTDQERRLTSDGVEADRYTTRNHLSPDGRYVVAIRVKPEQEHVITMVDSAPDDQLQPTLVTRQYLKPGDDIEQPRPMLIDLESGSTTLINNALFPIPWSLTRFEWDDDSSGFWFVYNERGHRVLRLIRVDADSGEARAVLNEEPETFVDYAFKTYLEIMPETRELLWMSERSGWNHLYRFDLDSGTLLNPVTEGAWVVRQIVSLDPESRTAQIRGMGVHEGQNPYYEHFGVASLDGGPVTWFTESDGNHVVDMSPSGDHVVAIWSRVDHPPVHELRRVDNGSLVAELTRADWSALLDTGWSPPERFVAKGRDGETDIHGIIFRPTRFDPEQRYPVIENIYAGPHGHHVPKSFAAVHNSRDLSELGFIVMQIDGMGTNWRHKAFHDVAWKNIGDAGFPDRIAWMKAAAATRPWMDLDRVGIYGGSAGGQNAMRALIAHNDFYDTAFADCGCHDNRMDKIWWNEAWMSWPIGPHYAEQSNVEQAHRMEGDLMLSVGELDTNVDPASTMQVVDALIRADKDFDLIVVPGAGHGAGGLPYVRRRMADFFVESLWGVEPRWE